MTTYCRTAADIQAGVNNWLEVTEKKFVELWLVFVCSDCDRILGDNADKVIICEQKLKPRDRIVCFSCFKAFAQAERLCSAPDDESFRAFVVEYRVAELEVLLTPHAAGKAYKFHRFVKCPEPVAA
jgi:hypothetical protein